MQEREPTTSISPEEQEALQSLLGSRGWQVLKRWYLEGEWAALCAHVDGAKEDQRFWQGRKLEVAQLLVTVYRLAGLRQPSLIAPLGDVSASGERSRVVARETTAHPAEQETKEDPWPKTEPSWMAPGRRTTHPA